MDAFRQSYPEKPVKTGRRLASEIDSPRDKTVCFMVSEDEKRLIDELGLAIGKTRSALLTRIVTEFVAEAFEDPGESGDLVSLHDFLSDCRGSVSKTA